MIKQPPLPIFIHGHYLVSKYDRLFPSAGIVTWLRDPVERVASHYYFWLRSPNMNHPICHRLIVEKLSLTEFAEIEGMRNVHSRLLKGKILDEFDFIGITEDYDRGVALFLKLFAPRAAPSPVAAMNQNHDKSVSRYEIDKGVRDKIAACNELDLALYEAGKRRFKELCDFHGL